MSKYCGFCASAGVTGPHDHALRASKDPKSAVTCPLLKAHKCTGCGVFGHTRGYCGETNDKERLDRQMANDKRRHEFNQGAWATTKVKTQPKLQEQKAAPNAKLSNPFDALNDSEEAKDEKAAEVAAKVAAAAAREKEVSWPAVGKPLRAKTVDGEAWSQVARRVRVSEDEDDSMVALVAVKDIVWGGGRRGRLKNEESWMEAQTAQ